MNPCSGCWVAFFLLVAASYEDVGFGCSGAAIAESGGMSGCWALQRRGRWGAVSVVEKEEKTNFAKY
ncbi:MAG: hypothetical protein QM751_09470 [Paludibacteraceae bacterium]